MLAMGHSNSAQLLSTVYFRSPLLLVLCGLLVANNDGLICSILPLSNAVMAEEMTDFLSAQDFESCSSFSEHNSNQF